jgi:hypothetical protein
MIYEDRGVWCRRHRRSCRGRVYRTGKLSGQDQVEGANLRTLVEAEANPDCELRNYLTGHAREEGTEEIERQEPLLIYMIGQLLSRLVSTSTTRKARAAPLTLQGVAKAAGVRVIVQDTQHERGRQEK